jgi:hypothetical protein
MPEPIHDREVEEAPKRPASRAGDVWRSTGDRRRSRTGGDTHSMALRRGRKLLTTESRAGLDTMAAAGWCKQTIDRHDPQRLFIDVGGVADGLRLRRSRRQTSGRNRSNRSHSTRIAARKAAPNRRDDLDEVERVARRGWRRRCQTLPMNSIWVASNAQ